jgi:hypothetical protein
MALLPNVFFLAAKDSRAGTDGNPFCDHISKIDSVSNRGRLL